MSFSSRVAWFRERKTRLFVRWSRHRGLETSRVSEEGIAKRRYEASRLFLQAHYLAPQGPEPIQEWLTWLEAFQGLPDLIACHYTQVLQEVTHQWEGGVEKRDTRQSHYFMLRFPHFFLPIYTGNLAPNLLHACLDYVQRHHEGFQKATYKLRSYTFPVVFRQGSGGLLAHELVGHPLEARIWGEELPFFTAWEGKMHKDFYVVDEPRHPFLPGSFSMDDEGYPAQRVILLTPEGPAQLLGDLQASWHLSCQPGNARVFSYDRIPYPRMSNTLVLPGKDGKINPKGFHLEVISLSDGLWYPSGKVELTLRLGFWKEGNHILGRATPLKLLSTMDQLFKNLQLIGTKSFPCWSFGLCLAGKDPVYAGAMAPDLFFQTIEGVSL